MKIAVIAANGKAGKLITNEAVNRGLDVTVVVRGENKTNATTVIQKDLFDLTKEDIAEFDVIIDAFGQPNQDKLDEHSKSLALLSDLVSDTKQRLLIIGGAGSLFVDAAHTMRLVDSPDFPEMFKKTALAQTKTLEEIQDRDDVLWTFISPAPDFQYEGQRTGSYQISSDEVIGTSVSYADYAIAMVDEAIEGKYIQKRFAVFSK